MAENTFSEQTTKNTEYTIKQCPWTQDGYTFEGWNTSPDGSGTPYGVGYVVDSGFSSDVDLYAQWTKNSTPHKLTVIVTSFPNGQGIDVTVGDHDGVHISDKREFPSVLAGTSIVLGTSDDYDQYNIKDDSGQNWDVSEEPHYQLEMPDRDYTLNIFVSSSTGTNFQCKDNTGAAVFQGILQELDEGYEYQIDVPICMIGHYGSATGHVMHCSMGYQKSDGSVYLFCNDGVNNTTIEYQKPANITSESKLYTIKHLHGKNNTSDYRNDGPDGIGYWKGSQNSDGTWKSDDDIKGKENGLLTVGERLFTATDGGQYQGFGNNTNTPAAFVFANTGYGTYASGNPINEQIFIIKPTGTGKFTIGIMVRDGATEAHGECTGIGAFIKLKVTRKRKLS